MDTREEEERYNLGDPRLHHQSLCDNEGMFSNALLIYDGELPYKMH